MKQADVFLKKHEDTLAKDQKAILEEMNLPPAVIDFIRKNSLNLKILIALLVIGVIAWEGYGKYTSVQREKSSALLYDAMSVKDTSAESDKLKSLIDEFPKTASAVWAKVELGHLSLNAEKFQEAAEYYSEALDALSKKNPMYPLVQFSLAQAYENLAETSKAKEAYRHLVEIGGFASEGYLGLGRIAEREGDLKQAVSQYQEYLNLPETDDGPTKEWAKAKILQLNSVSSSL